MVISYPNFFGGLDDVDSLTDLAASAGALVIGVVNPTAMALIKPPGEWGADIVVGTSAGSLVGALYAGGLNGFELQRLALQMDEAAIADWASPLARRVADGPRLWCVRRLRNDLLRHNDADCRPWSVPEVRRDSQVRGRSARSGARIMSDVACFRQKDCRGDSHAYGVMPSNEDSSIP